MNERTRAIIADDEPLARELLRTMLQSHPDIEVVQECGDGYEVVDAIREHRPELLFLDIEMPGLDGFEVVRAVGEDAMPTLVFVTAFDHFALEAFNVHAADYLLKPFDEQRLARTLDRIRRRHEVAPDRVLRLLEQLHRRTEYRDRLLVRLDGASKVFPVAEIDWLQADGKYTRLHAGTQTLLLSQGISELEAQLDPAIFVRVSRSAIVHIERVQEVQRWFKGEHLLILKNGVQVTTGRVYRHRIEAALGMQ